VRRDPRMRAVHLIANICKNAEYVANSVLLGGWYLGHEKLVKTTDLLIPFISMR
jgi:hypothetical protein